MYGDKHMLYAAETYTGENACIAQATWLQPSSVGVRAYFIDDCVVCVIVVFSPPLCHHCVIPNCVYCSLVIFPVPQSIPISFSCPPILFLILWGITIINYCTYQAEDNVFDD